MLRLIIIALVVLTGCSSPAPKFVMGDMVCVKGLGDRGVIKWANYLPGSKWSYKVIFKGGDEVSFSDEQSSMLYKCEAK